MCGGNGSGFGGSVCSIILSQSKCIMLSMHHCWYRCCPQAHTNIEMVRAASPFVSFDSRLCWLFYGGLSNDKTLFSLYIHLLITWMDMSTCLDQDTLCSYFAGEAMKHPLIPRSVPGRLEGIDGYPFRLLCSAFSDTWRKQVLRPDVFRHLHLLFASTLGSQDLTTHQRFIPTISRL